MKKQKKKRKKLRLFQDTHPKLGLPPGTPVHIGDIPDFKPYITVYQYNADGFQEFRQMNVDKLPDQLKSDVVTWVDVEGVHDIQLIKRVSEIFEIHPLTQEDVVNTNLRPQFEAYPDYLFFCLKMICLDRQSHGIHQEQVSIVLSKSHVISFQEKPGDVFEMIRQRIRSGQGKVRSRGAEYLVYILLDAIVDGYYRVVEHVGEKLEFLEEDLRQSPTPDDLQRIYDVKREILFLRKHVLPVRDLINKMQVEGTVYKDSGRIYIKDLADHVMQVSESIVIFNEMASVLLDTYHSHMNLRMNQIMKVLTMISTVFLPLNFIAGIYGMNFKHMPELEGVYSYPIVLLCMLAVGALMLIYFIRKGWVIERRRRPSGQSNES